MTDRDFIIMTRDEVFGVQCSLGGDGSLYNDLESIIQDCNDRLAEVREVSGIKFRIYPAVKGEGALTVEAMVQRPGVYFDDRSKSCSPRRVDLAIAELIECLSG